MHLTQAGGVEIEHGINTCGIWSKSESTRHINCSELLAVKLALSFLFNNRSDIHVGAMSDNTAAVSYINAMGAYKSLECNSLTQEIWNWAIVRNILL